MGSVANGRRGLSGHTTKAKSCHLTRFGSFLLLIYYLHTFLPHELDNHPHRLFFNFVIAIPGLRIEIYTTLFLRYRIDRHFIRRLKSGRDDFSVVGVQSLVLDFGND